MNQKNYTDAIAALKAAAEKFCRRRDAGEVRSTQSYADFKAALALLAAAEPSGPSGSQG